MGRKLKELTGFTFGLSITKRLRSGWSVYKSLTTLVRLKKVKDESKR